MTDDKPQHEDHCAKCDLPFDKCECGYVQNGDGIRELYDDLGEAGG